MSSYEITMQIVAVSCFVAVVACLFYIQRLTRKNEELEEKVNNANAENNKLKLGALERLTMYAERTKLDGLVVRNADASLTAREFQLKLIQTIKEEYDYNTTQQLYVKKEIWEAINKMKDQNLFIINQVGNLLPPNASAMDLSKYLLEYQNQNPKGQINAVVLEALQYEAGTLLNVQ
jgi:hypothetical protein